MNKKFYEFDSDLELNRHLKYWSNACGELHHHGEYALDDVSELPEELQRAYNELWKEGNGCYEYLVEYDGKYWHQDEQTDRRRDEYVKSQGYKVIRIIGNRQIPSKEILTLSIQKLIENNLAFTKIILD